MKILEILLVLFAVSFSAFAGPTPAPTAPPQFCATLDKGEHFTRCETLEIICYRFGKSETCYPRAQAPRPQPTATPTPTPEAKK